MKMTTEEAFVKVLQMHGIEHAFGIIGSAFMPISDLFGKAGITFWDVAHESNGGLICDGYTRSTGKMAMAIAQNGPGVTGFVTAAKTAYWNHSPMLLVTPQAANRTIGQGGFQELEQMALFRDIVGYQEEVRDPSRVPEVLNRVIAKAKRLSAPAQINIPRDFWTQVIDVPLPTALEFERPAGGGRAIAEAARLLSEARFPVILSGAGVVLGNAIPECMALAEKLEAPVCNNYQHNDSFPSDHPLSVGPLGYNGSRAAMELIAEADVVLALGTRLNPFSTLPCYGLDYWPKSAAVIQVDINADRIGLTKPVTVPICGDAKLVAAQLLSQLSAKAGDKGRAERHQRIAARKQAWTQTLATMDYEEDDPGTVWNADCPLAGAGPHVPASGLGGPIVAGSAPRCHLHRERHRQQLCDRQCLSQCFSAWTPVPCARALRTLRLRCCFLDHRLCQDRQSSSTPVVGFAGKNGAFDILDERKRDLDRSRRKWRPSTMW